MGHHISAVLLKGNYDEQRANSFGLRAFTLADGLTMFALDSDQVDHWSDTLGVSGFHSARPLLNGRVVHHIMNTIASYPLFAVIETEYFGGDGDQAAAVYAGAKEVMPPEVDSIGPINKALRLLGVVPSSGRDEFDTVGLGNYRDFDLNDE
jgi:hypothetical protein